MLMTGCPATRAGCRRRFVTFCDQRAGSGRRGLVGIADVRDVVPGAREAGSAPVLPEIGRYVLGVLTHLIAPEAEVLGSTRPRPTLHPPRPCLRPTPTSPPTWRRLSRSSSPRSPRGPPTI